MTNGEDIDNHKLQYFPNSLRGRAIDWFAKYETTHLTTAWGEVWRAFISRFIEIHNEGQAVATLKYAKQKKYEYVEDYYNRFLQLIAITWYLFKKSL